ncbi:hypothetical protein PSTG_00740 [Puccinia striiformis f. sp. tritici PST-78]|uniref:Uncharacterized protein n=1 Tax=Puccinia striiformis f. sp. tritici PST-78 TaxID=1165861 RepID=A0A0L0W3W3_9BASI|nr:hypothetical protein PSTG_00740 [Puccinia striiformis f. sp. tritici PST-78]
MAPLCNVHLIQTLSKFCPDLNKCGPGKAEYVVAISLPKLAGCHAACAEVHKKSQNIHVLVNNAGTIVTAPFNDVPEKEGWDDVLDLNVKSVFYLTSELTPELAKDANNIGKVIVMSSAAALHYNAEVLQKFDISGEGNWSYKASKASAMNLSTTLAVTLGPKFITVNAICPGFYPSEMTQPLYATIGDSIDKEHPMGRSGTPEVCSI